jgi:hypothetical protein
MIGGVLLATALAIGAGYVLPAASAAQAPAEDSVTASGRAVDPEIATGGLGCCSYSFTVAAHSGPSGQAARGTVAVSFGGRNMLPFSYSGHVSCLSVSGTRAVIGAIVDDASGLFGPAVGEEVTILAVDNRGPVVNLPTPVQPDADRFAGGGAAPGCASFPSDPIIVQSLYYVVDGDIAVRDAEALPGSKDACRHGGWRAFGVFKNQGDCVSFVATSGTNPPAKP